MARRSYKALWQQSEHERFLAEDSLDIARRELKRINTALAPFGTELLRTRTLGNGPLFFKPHEYVSVRAAILCNARYTSDDELDISSCLMWRGRPITELAK